MMDSTATQRFLAPSTLSTSLPFFAFALACAITLIGPLALGDVEYNRTRFTAWATLLLGAPALTFFVVRAGRIPLGASWLGWWTAGLVMYFIHLWFGFSEMLEASFRATFATQGIIVASSNFLLAGIWFLSVIVAWIGWSAIWLHAFASLLFAASAIGSSLIFGRPPSPLFGMTLVLALTGAVIWRLWLRNANANLEKENHIAAPVGNAR